MRISTAITSPPEIVAHTILSLAWVSSSAAPAVTARTVTMICKRTSRRRDSRALSSRSRRSLIASPLYQARWQSNKTRAREVQRAVRPIVVVGGVVGGVGTGIGVVEVVELGERVGLGEGACFGVESPVAQRRHLRLQNIQSYVQTVLYWAGVYSRGGYTVSNTTTVSAPECLTSAQTSAVPNQLVSTVIGFAREQLVIRCSSRARTAPRRLRGTSGWSSVRA
jgi:hypothetical protein